MIGFASWEMRPELAGLWRICFGETRRGANCFMNNLFRPHNCLIDREGERIAAMLHLLPARLVLSGGGSIRAHYIYACATHPDFRSQGRMQALLTYAASVGDGRGDAWSFLVPAQDSLFSYYERAGYHPFYQVEERELSREQMQALAAGARFGRCFYTAGQLNKMRSARLLRRTGSVLWSDAFVWYAAEAVKIYGGRIVCAAEGYALCRAPVNGVCEVTEWMPRPGGGDALAAALLAEIPAEKFRLRLPEGVRFPDGTPVLRPFGAIKPLGGASLQRLRADKPYLGLALD